MSLLGRLEMPLLTGLAELLVPLLTWIGRIMIVSLIARALAGFGLAFAVWHFAVGPILDAIKSHMVGWPADLAQWVGLLKFDQAVTVICSAYVIRFAVSSVHLVKS